MNKTIQELKSKGSVFDILNLKVSETKNYNQTSEEKLEECSMILGNPNGIIAYELSPHKTAYTIYKNMHKRDWVPSQVNTTVDRANYPILTQQEKRLYDLVLAQLITNDSVQTTQLPRISAYITSPCVASALIRQAYEEANHSESYSVMAIDIANDVNRIYNLHNEDQELFLKNQAVGDMYASIYREDKDMTVLDILMVMVANQILEELVFPGGFVAMYTLTDKLPGSVKMIEEINVGLLAA